MKSSRKFCAASSLSKRQLQQRVRSFEIVDSMTKTEGSCSASVSVEGRNQETIVMVNLNNNEPTAIL